MIAASSDDEENTRQINGMIRLISKWYIYYYFLPLFARFHKKVGSQARNRWGIHQFEDKTEDAVDRNLLDQLYPTDPSWLAFRQPSHWQSSYQNWWGWLERVGKKNGRLPCSWEKTWGVFIVCLHCRNIFAWKGICSIRDEQACFTDSTG